MTNINKQTGGLGVFFYDIIYITPVMVAFRASASITLTSAPLDLSTAEDGGQKYRGFLPPRTKRSTETLKQSFLMTKFL